MVEKRTPAREPGASARRADAAGVEVGVDVGATLAKLAIRRDDGPPEFGSFPAHALDRVARRVEATGGTRVGVTGGGAPRLAAALSRECVAVAELEAWAAGSRSLLRGDPEVGTRYLLVSLGTGCSAMLVGTGTTTRVGGTALGGGTALALGALLAGARSFEELTALARQGDRRRVDLCVSDIYREGGAPLPGDANAASLAKLAPPGPGRPADPRDVAHAIMGLVGENVAFICGHLAGLAGVDVVVYGGSTLRDNPALVDTLDLFTRFVGRRPYFLEHGAYTGALGALELVRG